MGVKLTKEMIEGAQQSEALYGVPASVTLGQIMLESGGTYKGGLSGLAYKYNNLFGVTAGSSWKGETITMSNKAGNDTKTYRVYDSIADSITDHAKVLLNSRYTQYTASASTVNEYVDGIAKGGYAEDTSYSDKLKKIITSNNLTAYDTSNWQGKSGKLTVKQTATSSNDNSSSNEETKDLKWWGDLIVIILCVLLIGLAVVFFISAFNGVSSPAFVKNAKKIKAKVKGGK